MSQKPDGGLVRSVGLCKRFSRGLYIPIHKEPVRVRYAFDTNKSLYPQIFRCFVEFGLLLIDYPQQCN